MQGVPPSPCFFFRISNYRWTVVKKTKYYKTTEFGDFQTHSKVEHTYCNQCGDLKNKLKTKQRKIEYQQQIIDNLKTEIADQKTLIKSLKNR